PGGQEAYNIDVNAVLKVVFTKSIDVNGFKNLVDNVQVTTNGNPIGIEYKFAENDTVLIVTPKQKLTDGTKYQFVLSSKIAAKDSQLQLKGNHSMEFTTNSFDKPTVMLKKNGVKAENIASTGGTYSIEAVYKNNIPQIGDYTETTTARVFVVVRGGKGARATYGGDVLLSKEQPLTIATDQTKTIISEAFTIPEGMKGNLYVDVYTWDDAESYAKALPVHNTYKIEK
ncbi:MAG: Ig-like domain-containing protein, partial [Anaerovorax sp.]